MAAGMEAMLKWAGQPAAPHLASPLHRLQLSGYRTLDLLHTCFGGAALLPPRGGPGFSVPVCGVGWGRGRGQNPTNPV